ncbi:MAG TPA: hypothetical protein VGH34_21405 [Vicinamibacterales bacterium]
MLNEPFVGWSDTAKSIVEAAINRHGGSDAWLAFEQLRVECVRFTGIVRLVKGQGRTFSLPRVFVIDPHAQRTAFLDYPTSGSTTVYAGGTVSLIDAASGRELERRERYRARFNSVRARLAQWSDLDVAYFLGYSQANYHAYPFVLPTLAFIAQRSYRRERAAWEALTLEYPASFDCHSRRQIFHFDATGLLRRVDYHVEIVGRASTSAHFYEDYVSVGGILFPRKRRIVARFLRLAVGLNLISLDLELECRSRAHGRGQVVADSLARPRPSHHQPE